MYYTACLLLVCQAIVSLVYKWEGLLKIVWGGGGCNPSNPPRSAPALQLHASCSVSIDNIISAH